MPGTADLVIVTRWTQTGPFRGIMADISEPMTVGAACQFIIDALRDGKGKNDDYSWRDANSEPAQ